ncbi:MAG: DnaA/Hda family protein [Pseudomonadota bacterium]|nr:MAG: DnaA regulatory inactivator Hda [Pseudomonadota bacterium]
MKQLLLELAPRPEPTLDNYVAGRNGAALAALRALADAPEAGAVVYLYGETGAGKSHLVHAVAEAWRRRGRPPAHFLAVDDAHRLDEAAQGALFDAFNEARAAGGAILAAGDSRPRELRVREDLRTRLASGLAFQLHPLSDEEKATALRQRAGELGMRLPDEVIAYLLTHLRRDMPTLIAVLEAIDRYSLTAKRPVTLPLIREALQALNGGAR